MSVDYSLVCIVCILPFMSLSAVSPLSEIYHLSAEPDYRFVTLHWEYPNHVPILHGFQIYYCELQAWGPNRCRTKMIDDSSGIQQDLSTPDYRKFSVIVNGLRMATNYSFEVKPMESRRIRYYMDSKMLSRRIIVPTKGFSARASLCLPDVSEVIVSTGPYFAGRIAVETAQDGEHCAVDGDGTSSKDKYVLRIEHKLCGSRVNRTAVATFILVQENLPILTHSTRRFLVLCTFQPETLTVRAGINLPSTSSGSFVSQPIPEHNNQMNDHNSNAFISQAAPLPDHNVNIHMNEVSNNDVQASPLQQYPEKFTGRQMTEETEAQMVLLTVVAAAGLVALGLMVWWFFPFKTREGDVAILSDDSTSTSTTFDNYQNSIRDSSELDFEVAQPAGDGEEEEENVLREGVCNEILQETCSVFTLDSLPTVEHLQSEA